MSVRADEVVRACMYRLRRFLSSALLLDEIREFVEMWTPLSLTKTSLRPFAKHLFVRDKALHHDVHGDGVDIHKHARYMCGCGCVRERERMCKFLCVFVSHADTRIAAERAAKARVIADKGICVCVRVCKCTYL